MNVSRQPFVVAALLAGALGALCVAGRAGIAGAEPLWTGTAGAAMAVVALALIVQLSVRMSPSGASRNYLPVQVFVVAACAAGVPTPTGLGAALLTVMGLRRAAMTGEKNRFENVFRAGLFFGLAALVYPAAAGVAAVMVPAALVIYKRGAREWIVAVAGLWLPMGLAAFANWALGAENFVQKFWAAIVAPSGWPGGIDARTAIIGGATIALALTAMVAGWAGRKGVRPGSRRFMAAAGVLTAATLGSGAVPGVGPDVLPVMGVGAACVLPYGFVGKGAAVTTAGWLLMVAGVAVAFFA